MKTIKTKVTIYVQLLLIHVIWKSLIPLSFAPTAPFPEDGSRHVVRELSARKPEIILDAPMMYQFSQFSTFCKYFIFKQCPP